MVFKYGPSYDDILNKWTQCTIKANIRWLLLSAFAGCLNSGKLIAQDISGLWLVEEVQVQNDIKTPRAKWFWLGADSSFAAGNGWQQNEAGVWHFDHTDSTFFTEPRHGLKDPYGSFDLRLDSGKMTWTRYEDDMLVTVKLTRIEQVPSSLPDQLVGLWQLDSTKIGDTNVFTDSAEPEYLFLRWDREFRISMGSESTGRGYWHLHGHRPELSMIDILHELKLKKFEASLSEDLMSLSLEGKEKAGYRKYYHRVTELDIP